MCDSVAVVVPGKFVAAVVLVVAEVDIVGRCS